MNKIESIIQGRPLGSHIWTQTAARDEMTAAITEIKTRRAAQGKGPNPATSGTAKQLEDLISGASPMPVFGTQRQWHALADAAASELKELRGGGCAEAQKLPDRVAARLEHNAARGMALPADSAAALAAHQAAAAGKTPSAVNPSAAPAAAKPAAPAASKAAPLAKAVAVPAGTITADQFRASVARPTMSRAEFEKLTHPERNAFFRSGGKLTA